MSWLQLIPTVTNLTLNATTGFSFEYLWQVALYLNQTTPGSSSLYHPHGNLSRICLTYDACIKNVGPGHSYYDRRDVYDRVLLWRVPLIALIATTTLPALGWHTQIFTVLHLIADPIDTLWSLFYKLDLARRHADWAAERNSDAHVSNGSATFVRRPEGFNRPGPNFAEGSNVPSRRRPTGLSVNPSLQEQIQRLRKDGNKSVERFDFEVIASIVNAYQEWHYGDQAKQVLDRGLARKWNIADREGFRAHCEKAAAYIAADRVARILPSFVATLVFFAQLFAAFWKTLDVVGDHPDIDNSPSLNVNRAPHNIAFGALYFWLPFAVLSTAIVGGAQTENSVPRILNRLREDTEEILGANREAAEEEGFLMSFPVLKFSMSERRVSGGLPTWQLDKFDDWTSDNHRDIKFFFFGFFMSTTITIIPAIAAIWVSWRTPTEGFGCRSVTQASFFVSWLLNVTSDWILSICTRRSKGHGIARSQRMYWITFAKDFLLTSGAIIALTSSAIGVFNSCNCWTKWFPDHSGGQRYLSFPEEQFVFDNIRRRLKYEFAIVTTVALGLELFIFVLVRLYFRRGSAVLLQRDLEAILTSEYMRVGWRDWFADGIRNLFQAKKSSGTGPNNRISKKPADTNGTTRAGGGESNRDDNNHTNTTTVPSLMLSRDRRTDTSSLEAQARPPYRRSHLSTSEATA